MQTLFTLFECRCPAFFFTEALRHNVARDDINDKNLASLGCQKAQKHHELLEMETSGYTMPR